MWSSLYIYIYIAISNFRGLTLLYFTIHLQVSYVAFILLYAYVITMYFPRFDSSQTFGGLSAVELILYFWIFTIIVEEIRQVSS